VTPRAGSDLSANQPGVEDARARPGIGDYGFLSDCHSAALVDRHGAVDWWCVPRFDSPSVFGRLLDPAAGHWDLHPDGDFTTERHYVGDTLVLRTIFRTDTGEVELTDALALERGARGHDIGRQSPHVLARRVRGRSGVVAMRTELAPRMEYGRTQPHLRPQADGVEFRGGPVRLSCTGMTGTGPVSWDCAAGAASAVFPVAAGETVELTLTYTPLFGPAPPVAEPTVADTVAGWESWAALHTSYRGGFPAQVRRSSVILQGLTFQPSGAVVAAATTSLPERLGGADNFDYRYAWLRDLSLSIRALWVAACPQEPGRLFDWFANAAGHLGDELVQIMYGVEGERDLTEHELEHLSGYRDNRPVRVGNQAWTQQQSDVYGEVLDAAFLLREQLGDLQRPVQDMLVTLADRAATGWAEPDAGMWESREKPRHYVSSKVMCWVALDRAIQMAPALGPDADPARWAAARDEVRAAILQQAWSDRAGAYAGAFGSDDLDASVLLLPLVGFLPATDERMWATIGAIEVALGDGYLVRRWPDDPSGFLICTYWLVECLALGGEPEAATEWFHRATGHANDLGLLAEEADPDTGVLLGNFPQAFSHIGLINAAWRLGQLDHPTVAQHGALTAAPSDTTATDTGATSIATTRSPA